MTTQLPAYTDGYIINHVAEFVYFSQAELKALYAFDKPGYIDSVSRFCQMLISIQSIAFPRGVMPLEAAHYLRDELSTGGKTKFVSSMDWKPFEQHRPAAYKWLQKHWEKISSQIKEDKFLQGSLLGLLKRDFKTYVLSENPIWYPPHYWSSDERLTIDSELLDSFCKNIQTTFENSQQAKDRKELLKWIETLITTHYAIFEYHLKFGAVKEGCYYTPGLTRSKLDFLYKTDDPSVDYIVLPYIALSLLKRLKHRSELISKLVEWPKTDEEKWINEGFINLQIAIQTGDQIERKKLLTEVHKALESKTKNKPNMRAAFYRTSTSVESSGGTSDEISDSRTMIREAEHFAWLWSISSPSVLQGLAKEIDRLVNTS